MGPESYLCESICPKQALARHIFSYIRASALQVGNNTVAIRQLGLFSDSCNDVWDCRLLVYPNRQVVKLSAALSVWHATVFTRRSVPVSLLAKIWFWNVLSCRLWLVHIWSAGRKAGRKEATLTRRLENIVTVLVVN